MSETDEALRRRVADELRRVREEARDATRGEVPAPPPGLEPAEPLAPLPALEAEPTPPGPRSPDRDELNRIWNLAEAADAAPEGLLGRLLRPLRGPLRRALRFGLGPVVERQTAVNAAQVRFDNELVAYLDARIDAVSEHYDRVLGLHGKRMEEIDERHRILQQELVRHVHDLVQRIEFVFETAEQNHLYLEGAVRELRDELRALAERLDGGAPSPR